MTKTAAVRNWRRVQTDAQPRVAPVSNWRRIHTDTPSAECGSPLPRAEHDEGSSATDHQYDADFKVKGAATRRVPLLVKQLAGYGITDANVRVETATNQFGDTVYRLMATY